MSPYRILSLDGGGIRGVLTATILERLEERQPGFLTLVDLFAGTSTGGILALALASGMTAEEVRDLYVRFGEKVFKDSFWDNVKDLGQLAGAQYSNKALKEELRAQFGNMTLRELPKKVLISAFDLDNEENNPAKRHWKAKFFHNFPGDDSDGHEKVVDVALRTSAAPTYFPVFQGYVDGGVVANNPTLCALAQALAPDAARQPLRNIRLLSIGTGFSPHFVAEQDCDWGYIEWAPHLVSMMMDGSVGLADYQAKQLLGKYYHRINPHLPVRVGMDDVKQINLLRGLGGAIDLEDARAWLKRYFRQSSKAKTG